MERISGGQTSVGAVPRSYQVTPAILGRRRATEPKPVRPQVDRAQGESARRRPRTQPRQSDNTDRPSTIPLRSTGVHADEVAGTSSRAPNNRRYVLLNQPEIRSRVLEMAAERFGYTLDQVELRLYVGKFAGKPGTHDARVREWCASQHAGRAAIRVVGVDEVVARVRQVATKKQYRDNAALVALKVLDAAGALKPSDDTHGG